jgi:hypothetical protein
MVSVCPFLVGPYIPLTLGPRFAAYLSDGPRGVIHRGSATLNLLADEVRV